MTAIVALALGIGGYALQAARVAAPPSNTDATGSWSATLSPDETLSLSLRQTGDQVELNSRPVPISQRADWAEYRSFWRERFGSELDTVTYRGKGSASALPGEQLVVDIALQIVSTPGDVLVDTGNLNATITADGSTMAGTLWLNGKQLERPLRLAREPRREVSGADRCHISWWLQCNGCRATGSAFRPGARGQWQQRP
jgi:hypothetical protein